LYKLDIPKAEVVQESIPQLHSFSMLMRFR